MYAKATIIYCAETKSTRKLSLDEAKDYIHNGGTSNRGMTRCAVFKKKNDGNTYLQPWAWLSFLRKKGTENISAKLDDAKALEIFKRSTKPQGDQDTVAALAAEFDVNVSTIRDIQHLRRWRHVIMPSLKPKALTVLAAKNNAKGTKISPGIARFIVRDNLLHKISVASLAVKYNLSKSSIRKIVAGKAWKEATKEILKDVSKWIP